MAPPVNRFWFFFTITATRSDKIYPTEVKLRMFRILATEGEWSEQAISALPWAPTSPWFLRTCSRITTRQSDPRFNAVSSNSSGMSGETRDHPGKSRIPTVYRDDRTDDYICIQRKHGSFTFFSHQKYVHLQKGHGDWRCYGKTPP